MRRSHVVIGAIVVAIVLLVAWKLSCGGGDSADSTTEGTSSAAGGAAGGSMKRGKAGPSVPASLSGRVTRKSDGSGVPGAAVSIARIKLTEFLDRDDDSPTTVVTTDATGAWTVPAIAPATYVVAATATGFLPGVRDKLVVASGSRTTVDLVLVPGGTAVSGTVSDVTGGPIGGAHVTITRNEAVPFASRPELVAVTGADGRYQISLVDGPYAARAAHDDYTHTTKYFHLQGEPLAIDFVLAPGSQIRGQVVTREGKPVADAILVASNRREMFGGGGAGATSDASGNFTLKGLQSGVTSIKATARGYTSLSPTVVEVGIGEQIEGVRVVVDRALTISGRVVRKGKPAEGVPGIYVGVFSMSTPEATATATEPTDDSGAFEIPAVRPASFTVFALGEGVVPEFGKTIEVVDRDIKDVVVEIESGVTLSGRVEPGAVASIGLELAQDKVGIGNIFEMVKVMLARGDSDETGVFAIHGVPPGEMTLVATTTDGRKGKLPVKVTTADQAGLVVRLEARAAFAGTVVDANGAPVAGVRVQLRPAHENKASFSINTDANSTGALTGANGGFRAVGLDPGKILVHVSDEHGQIPWAKGDKRDDPLPFELTKGQAMTGVTLTVEARDGVIRGLVVGADRKPVPDAWVTPQLEVKAMDRADMMAAFREPADPVLTNSEGRFVLARLRRGTYKLVAEGPRGSSRTEKTGVKPGDSVTLTLEPLGTLAGRVTLGSTPVTPYDLQCGLKPGANGRIDFDDFSPERRFTAADGTYLLERLAPGEYTCHVTADTGTATGKVTIGAGPAKLDMALVPWASLTGVVVSVTTGEPVKGLNVFFHGEAGQSENFGDVLTGKGPTTDASGRFVVEKVPSGKGKLSIVPREAFNELAKRDYTAAPGQRVDLGTIKVVPPRVGDSGTIGLTTANDDGKLSVASVMPEGPADQAGVQGGDRIISIDGKPVADMGVEVAQGYLFSGSLAVGQRVQLGLEREGKSVQIACVAVKW